MVASAPPSSTLEIPEVFNSGKFWVESNNILEAYFQECNGLDVKTEVYEYKEGGLNTYVHKFPVRTSYTNITLKRGFTTSKKMWEWYMKTVNGTVQRQNISIILYSGNTPGSEVRRWNVFGAYPVKWTGPQLNAKGGEPAVETLELAFTHFQMVT